MLNHQKGTLHVDALVVSLAVALLAAGQALADDRVAASLLPDDSRTWSQADRARVLGDFSQVTPADGITAGRRQKGRWKVISYATADREGVALSAYRSTEPVPVRLPLEATGWHAVYVGVCTVSAGLDKADANGVRVKLSGEAVYRRMSNTLPLLKPRRDQIQEVFLTVADLTGQSLDVEAMPFKPATVCYVKLVPLTDDEVARWQQPRAPGSRGAVVTFDGHSWIWPYRPRTADELRENFRGFEGTGLSKWWFQVLGADLVCYPSQVGNIPGEGTEDFCRWEYAEFTESLKALFAAGVNPLRVAREEARRQGAEFHVMIRPAGWSGSMPFEEIFNSRFYEQHPEWRCIDRDGTPALHLSYAWPQVRQQVLSILKETLALEPEGVGFLFHRGMPMILWEEPFLREFQEKYQADARQVPEDDPRILDLRAELMTRLLREVRTLLDETARDQKRSKPYTISLATFSTEADNRKFGLDVPRWIREGLVDSLGIAWFAHHTSFKQPDVAYYRKLTEGTQIPVHPFVIAWNTGQPQALCRRITEFYTQGADGIAVWDATVEAGWRDASPGHPFDVLSRITDRGLMADWARTGVPLPLAVPLTRMGDNHYSRWFPNTGY